VRHTTPFHIPKGKNKMNNFFSITTRINDTMEDTAWKLCRHYGSVEEALEAIKCGSQLLTAFALLTAHPLFIVLGIQAVRLYLAHHVKSV